MYEEATGEKVYQENLVKSEKMERVIDSSTSASTFIPGIYKTCIFYIPFLAKMVYNGLDLYVTASRVWSLSKDGGLYYVSISKRNAY